MNPIIDVLTAQLELEVLVIVPDVVVDALLVVGLLQALREGVAVFYRDGVEDGVESASCW